MNQKTEKLEKFILAGETAKQIDWIGQLSPSVINILRSAYHRDDIQKIESLLARATYLKGIIGLSPFNQPDETYDGVIRIGESEQGFPIGLNFPQNTHIIVAGASGTGKSTLFKLMIMQILKYNEEL